jgi:hypothetical protein
METILLITAILLSGFTFYWTTIRNPKALHIINVKDIGAGMFPQFAIVNGSKKDILITNLVCSFTNDQNSIFTPAQTLEFKGNDSFLLQSEKAFHCKVTFKDPFTSSFAKKGKLESENNKEFYMYEMLINIAWVEMNGKRHEKSVKFLKYGFRKNGEIGKYVPHRKGLDLYKLKS